MADLLNDTQISEALATLSDWQRDGDSIVKTTKLDSFGQAIAVVNRVAELAESVDHHPDIDIRWRTLTFRLSTHSDGGITGKDVSLAQQIDETINSL
ncbi:4a-hydroxytetrahydrobiopterin dehydratase [Amycolatopsis sp. CA-230715]|uniref:4a-hydroxytetrahydrobiopterin dehydratase n=1 Tax=Amycolatopsis sp. CA-230715 TaxID=2745196 RepID=UPI001C012164|nr:4a-hydroxytetrahydrobiopterin dehydratase [Amycolatopsis sp. CA-230715]QWF82181.1 Putative pterin-4-alpha-carbinolamine dehydratase [Amycolatopsis sp. CA-230715]